MSERSSETFEPEPASTGINSESPREYRVIGTRPIRPDGVDKVTGRALYGADMRLPGMLFGAVLRSPHAHARILSIDVRGALALPGVKGVVTSADMPELESQLASLGVGAVKQLYQSWNILARGKVLYYGHVIAAVAASSPHIAQEALSLIQVEYEILPHVLDPVEGMHSQAPILLEGLRTEEMGARGELPSNIACHFQMKEGDLEQGFREAAVVVEREFHTSMVHQGYIEPQNALAQYNSDGQLTIWCSTQGAFGVRAQVAELLQISVAKIRVIPMEIGGGFGGKIRVYLEPLAALLSRKCSHRPVRMSMSYADVLSATGPSSGSFIRVKMGADTNGRITAAQAYMVYEAGAFPGSPVDSGMNAIFSPYRIPNYLLDGYDVVVNKPHTAAYRAPGGTNAVFACESVVDELSEKLGIDLLEFRQVNAVREGDRRVGGAAHARIGALEVIDAARHHPHLTSPLGGPNRGRGIALAGWDNYGGRSSASATVNEDGTVILVVGSVDIGGSRASMAMQMAETLQIALADVKPLVADTDGVGYTEGTYGSRTTFTTGWAVYELGLALIDLMSQRAAQYWEVESDQVRYADGIFQTGGECLTFKELAAILDETGGPLVASRAAVPVGEGSTFSLHIVDVEVDPETGKVDLLRYTALQDVGKAIHPSYVEGQLQGGAAQGIGWALNEGYVYDSQGHLLNASLLDYRVPTCLDLPMIDAVLVEVPNSGHPFGVRGVGEAPILPPPAAIANAIYRATGARMRVLPMSPTRVMEAMEAD